MTDDSGGGSENENQEEDGADDDEEDVYDENLLDDEGVLVQHGSSSEESYVELDEKEIALRKQATDYGLFTDSSTDDGGDGMESFVSYSQFGSEYLPAWLAKESFEYNRETVKKRKFEMGKRIAAFRAGPPMYQFHPKQARKTKAWLRKHDKYGQEPFPSFETLMKNTEGLIKLMPEEAQRKVERDEKDRNFHFEPKYLNKDWDAGDWHFMELVPEIYPNIIDGKFNKRNMPTSLI
jgi:hypothetical protein